MEAKAYYSEESNVNIGTGQRIASVTGGAFLLFSGIRGLKSPNMDSLLRAVTGGWLLYRGASGYCPITKALTSKGKSLNIRETISINRPPYEVYSLWRNLEYLPKFMNHLSKVTMLDDKRSHWEAKIPGIGAIATVSWDAEILIDNEAHELSWRSIEGSAIDNAGKILFEPINGGQGTEIRAVITYTPPAGQIGKAVSQLANPAFERMIREDLQRFKQMTEGSDTSRIQIKNQGISNGHLA